MTRNSIHIRSDAIKLILSLLCAVFSFTVADADIVLIGDSIVADVREPLFGWGEVLPTYLESESITNRASSGASSRSYYESYWTSVGWPFSEPTRDVVISGDFVFIQFGHNDIPSGPPAAAVQDLDEYQMWLTTIVDEVQDLDALPVFITPPEGWAHRRSGNIGPLIQRQGHADAMKAVAALANAPVIDLHAYSVEQFATRTEEEAIADFEAINPETQLPTGDKTHTSFNGANIWAEFVADQFPTAAIFYEYASTPGDFNLDGEITMADFLILSQNFNQSLEVPDSFLSGDGNLDGTVNLADFLIFRREFNAARSANGEPSSVASVPEPSTASQAVLTLLAFVALFRRIRPVV